MSMETEDKNAKEQKGSVAVAAVMSIAKSKSKPPCYRCRCSGYGSKECPFHDAKCHKCEKLGHIALACCFSNKSFSNLKKLRNSPEC